MAKALPLDLQLLDETLEAESEGLRTSIDSYLAQADETLECLRAAIYDGQSDTVHRLACNLAGASAACGAAAMVDPLRMLEQLGYEDQLLDAEPLVATIFERLELCRRLLEEYMAQKGV